MTSTYPTHRVYSSDPTRYGDAGTMRAPWVDLGMDKNKRVSGDRSKRAVLVTRADGSEFLAAPHNATLAYNPADRPKGQRQQARKVGGKAQRVAEAKAERLARQARNPLFAPMGQQHAEIARPHDAVDTYQ